MEVAFYHEDNLPNYEQQSSPSSVGSACSTDIGVVSAIGRPYLNFDKDTTLKGLNLDLSPREQLKQQHLKSIEHTVIASQTGGLPYSNSQHHQHCGVITNAFGGLQSTHTLASPDINMLKLGSPDIERLISHSQHSNGGYMQQKPPQVTQEQEMYAQGFERELERIKSRSGSDPDITGSRIHVSDSVTTGSPQCSVITSGVSEQMARQHQPFMHDQYYNSQPTSGMGVSQSFGSTVHHMTNPVIAQLKEEPPQTVPVMSHTPPMSPIDLVNQEMLKSERKRQRNRIAASKCRKRKLERISRLEDKVKSLKNQNMELSTNANILRQQVAELKSKVMAHVNSGCQLMMSQQQVTY